MLTFFFFQWAVLQRITWATVAPGQFNSSQETPYLERDFYFFIFFFLETLQTSFLQLEKLSLILLTSCVCPGEFYGVWRPVCSQGAGSGSGGTTQGENTTASRLLVLLSLATGGFVVLRKAVYFPSKVILMYKMAISSQKPFFIVELISFLCLITCLVTV